MREYRIIAAFTAILVVVLAIYFFTNLIDPGAGELDELAAHRIATSCAYRQECKVNLRDLFDGDWDTLWEFAPGVTQQQLQSAVPGIALNAPSGKRLLVLVRNSTVAAHAYEPVSTTPIDHQLIFEDAARDTPAIVHYPRDTWLWVQSQPAPAGLELFYRLSPDNR